MSLCYLPHKFPPSKAINQYVSLTQQKLSPHLGACTAATVAQCSFTQNRHLSWIQGTLQQLSVERWSRPTCFATPSLSHWGRHFQWSITIQTPHYKGFFQIWVPYCLKTSSLLSKTPYLSLQEWLSRSKEMLQDQSSSMLWLFATTSGIQNLRFVYWYQNFPSISMTPFPPLDHKWNRTSLSPSSLEDWAKTHQVTCYNCIRKLWHSLQWKLSLTNFKLMS